jgi:hypothetical protein
MNGRTTRRVDRVCRSQPLVMKAAMIRCLPVEALCPAKLMLMSSRGEVGFCERVGICVSVACVADEVFPLLLDTPTSPKGDTSSVSDRTPLRHVRESGVGVALWGAGEIDARSRFETVSQRESHCILFRIPACDVCVCCGLWGLVNLSVEGRKGIGSGEIPVTSAGYHTKDGGYLRQQVYGIVRQLDTGGLSSAGFRSRLAGLGTNLMSCLLHQRFVARRYAVSGRTCRYFAVATCC